MVPSSQRGIDAWKSKLLFQMEYMQPCDSISLMCLCSFSLTSKLWCSFSTRISSSLVSLLGFFGSTVGKLQLLSLYSLPSISMVPFS